MEMGRVATRLVCAGVSANLTADVWSKSPRELAHVFCRALRKKVKRETDFFCKVFSSQLKGMSERSSGKELDKAQHKETK